MTALDRMRVRQDTIQALLREAGPAGNALLRGAAVMASIAVDELAQAATAPAPAPPPGPAPEEAAPALPADDSWTLRNGAPVVRAAPPGPDAADPTWTPQAGLPAWAEAIPAIQVPETPAPEPVSAEAEAAGAPGQSLPAEPPPAGAQQVEALQAVAEPPPDRDLCEAQIEALRATWPDRDMTVEQIATRLAEADDRRPPRPRMNYSAIRKAAVALGLPASRLDAFDAAARQAAAQADARAAAAEAPPPAPAPVKWTPERKAVIASMFGARDDAAMAAAINALPGPAATIEQCIAHAGYMGLKRPRPPAAPPLPAAPRDGAADGKMHRATLPAENPHKAEAMKLLLAGMSGRTVAEEMGLPLSDVSNWAAEAREILRQQRSAA
ncbi:hypothetical protein [Falsiroseomonas selenitidurans]|uniref:Uncharacterized protein n=1 Tax=Falsiroseomonas selenitidurans TaxID=2716335 RepID=A0ABX1ED64_9PROT|nr:hypothetical protein [Falsiroseomonas selenitidurans]NKC33472.1 hypothetical protein [Falsiroseomonas selenitidurans]